MTINSVISNSSVTKMFSKWFYILAALLWYTIDSYQYQTKGNDSHARPGLSQQCPHA